MTMVSPLAHVDLGVRVALEDAGHAQHLHTAIDVADLGLDACVDIAGIVGHRLDVEDHAVLAVLHVGRALAIGDRHGQLAAGDEMRLTAAAAAQRRLGDDARFAALAQQIDGRAERR